MPNKITNSTIVLVFMIVAAMLSISTLAQASPPELLEQKKLSHWTVMERKPTGISTPVPTNMIYLPLLMKNFTSIDDWTIIGSEDFEGDFPGTGWVLGDSTSGSYQWGKRTCRPYEGNNSAWAVGGGSSGSGLPCGSDYPDDVQTWMDYGPFDLSDATAAKMNFSYWTNTEEEFDYFCWGAKLENSIPDLICASGTTAGWLNGVFDLSPYLGKSNVWITFEFDSDESISMSEGFLVDNVEIRKCTLPSCSGTSNDAGFLPNGSFSINERPSTRAR